MARQVSLVSLSGPKRSPAFEALVARCQQVAVESLGDAFAPYAMEQIHATLVGLERRGARGLINANAAAHRGQEVDMDLEGFLGFLRSAEHLPFRAQIGGFKKQARPFLSQGKSPYERSFSVQRDRAVVIGWPVVGPSASGETAWPQPLDALRHAAQRFGIVHAYHRRPGNADNDFYFRIGLVDEARAPEARVRALERRVREVLSEAEPVVVEIARRDLSVVAYTDPTLPLASTERWPLASPQVDAAFVASLYV